MRRRFPAPASHRIRSGLRQHRMSAFHVDGLHAAIGLDQGVHSYYAFQPQATRQSRISWRNMIQQFPPAGRSLSL